MNLSARTIALYFLASLLTGAAVSLFVHFNRFHLDYRVQLLVGLTLVLFFVMLGGKLIHYRQSLKQANDTQERLREELIKQKDMFITRLGHDLKTPLTPLVALLPLILTRASDKKQCELINICISNARHIKELLGKTIQIARLSSQSAPPFNMFDLALAAVLDEYITAMAVELLGHETVIENLVHSDILVQADPQQLEVVFQNLISNALKYSPPSSLISINAFSVNGLVTITVKDSGIGLSPEEQSQIFDAFYKADPSRHDLGSSGLGLTICRQIIERHGGRVWAESPGLGMGTAISFTLSEGGVS